MRTLNDIRSTFLDYFKRQGHEVVQSSPLVPRNDPTLMFANSGMVQFKNLFTGVETRDYNRAVTSQNVLEQVVNIMILIMLATLLVIILFRNVG